MTVVSNAYTGNGSQVDFVISFPYLDQTHVKATLNGVASTAFTFFNATTLRFSVAPANGVAIRLYRETPGDTLLGDFTFGGAIREEDLEDSLNQVLFVTQETVDLVNNSDSTSLEAAIVAANATANTALTTANSASATASGIAGSVATANTTASNAVTTANAAVTTANAASVTASAAAPINNATFTGTHTVPLLNGGQLAGLRNRIINGSMLVDQRNAGASQTLTAAAALAYTADRWYAYCTGANVTGQRITVAGAVNDPFRYQFTGAASVTGIGVGQRIEATNCRDLAGTTATLSASFSNSLLTTVNWQAFFANTTDTFGTLASPTRTSIASGSFTINSTYTRYSTQISIPSAATTGIEVVFTVGAQTSGTWVIGSVQLESGTVATPFEQRPGGLEEFLCRRYFIKGNITQAYNPGGITNDFVSIPIHFGQPMRAIPSVTGAPSQIYIESIVYTPYILPATYSLAATYTASAEL